MSLQWIQNKYNIQLQCVRIPNKHLHLLEKPTCAQFTSIRWRIIGRKGFIAYFTIYTTYQDISCAFFFYFILFAIFIIIAIAPHVHWIYKWNQNEINHKFVAYVMVYVSSVYTSPRWYANLLFELKLWWKWNASSMHDELCAAF